MYHFFLLCLPVTPAPSGAEMQKFVPQATAQFVIQLPTRTAPMILSQGFKFAKKKKKTKKPKITKKVYHFFLLCLPVTPAPSGAKMQKFVLHLLLAIAHLATCAICMQSTVPATTIKFFLPKMKK